MSDKPAVDRTRLAIWLYQWRYNKEYATASEPQRLMALGAADALISALAQDADEFREAVRRDALAAVEAITARVDGDVEWVNRAFVLEALNDPDSKFLAAAMDYARRDALASVEARAETFCDCGTFDGGHPGDCAMWDAPLRAVLAGDMSDDMAGDPAPPGRRHD